MFSENGDGRSDPPAIGWRHLAALFLSAVILGATMGASAGIAFNFAARPTFERAERFVDSINKLFQ